MSVFEEPDWKDDGHIIEITKVKPDDYVEFKITCPGEGECAAGSLLCDDWDSGCDHGVLHDEDGDEIGSCPTCTGTGKKDGRHHCWLLNGNDNHEALQSYGELENLEIGRHKLLVAPDYEPPDDYFVYLKVGDPIERVRLEIGGPWQDSSAARIEAYRRAEAWGWDVPQGWVWIGAPLVDDPSGPKDPLHSKHGSSWSVGGR